MITRHYMLKKDKQHIQFTIMYKTVDPTKGTLDQYNYQLINHSNRSWQKINEGLSLTEMRLAWFIYIKNGFARVEKFVE